MKTLQDAENFLNKYINLEKLVSGRHGRMSLDPMRALVEKLGNPQRSFRSIHVTGSYGKGSTCHFLSVLLRRLGFKVGVYSSPHLERITERIQVNGKEIAEDDFASICGSLTDFAEGSKASYFDLLTAAAFLHFQREKVDWAIVEVGLGGRLDSTNILFPKLSIITSIGSDHSDVLGKTTAEKAREKGGIVKPAVALLCAVENKSANVVLENICKERNSPLLRVPSDFPLWKELALPKLPAFQKRNLSIALSAFERLEKTEPGFKRALALKGDPQEFSVPGRFERIEGSPEFVLDGAHMPEAIEALVEALESEKLPKPHLVLFAASADKDAPAMLKSLRPWADTLLVTAANTPRAIPISTLKSLAQELGMKAASFSSPREALVHAKASSEGQGTVLVTGSFYLVGEIKKLLKEKVQS